MLVDKSGRGDYTTIGEALRTIDDSNTEPVIIYINYGVYNEKLIISQDKISLLGVGGFKPIISYGDYAKKKDSRGEEYGTFNSYTLLVTGKDFYCENIVIENSAGRGKEVGQAIAAYVDGDRAGFKNCDFIGCQDTLFTGPLPEKEIIPNGFKGPRQFSPRINTRQYYENCYIEGDVDFIFGSATVYFEKCQIHSKTGVKLLMGILLRLPRLRDRSMGMYSMNAS